MRRVWLVFLFSLVLAVSRRPDVLFHAQFWAEDGKSYADAYNHGAVATLFHPTAGYLVTLPRLAAMIAQFIPLGFVPLMFSLVGIVIQILPVSFLMSSRCREFGSEAARCLFAFLYLGLPNSTEMHGNITNAQWYLALLALLILFARPGKTRMWNTFDLCVLCLSALTGPFIIFIAPIAVVYFFIENRNQWRKSLLWIALVGAVLQVVTVIFASGDQRPVDAVRAATPGLLIQILAKQVFLATLVGRRTLSGYAFNSSWGWITAILAVLAGITIELYVLFRAPLAWKIGILFSACLLGVSLAYPMTLSPQWPALLAAGGVRYWFFPMLAFIVSIVWMLKDTNPLPVRGAAAGLLLVMLFGMIQDWGHQRPIDLQFPAYVRTFSDLPAGAKLVVPINPLGEYMMLVKH